MLALIRARQYAEQHIPEGVFPKRQAVGTSIATSTTAATTTAAVTITQTTAITISMSVVESIASSILDITTPTITSSSTTQTVPSTTSAQPPSTTSLTTPSATPTTSSSTTSSTTSSTSSTTSSTPLAVTSSDVVVVGSTTINRSSLTGATTITSALVGVQTNANGQVVSSTTGYATATIEPVLTSDNSGSSSSLSPHSQAIIGGVVGGVGGLILLGGLAFVAWRLWGKKKNGTKLPQDDYYTGHEELQKENTGDGLERYRTPGRPAQPAMSVNASSNF